MTPLHEQRCVITDHPGEKGGGGQMQKHQLPPLEGGKLKKASLEECASVQ